MCEGLDREKESGNGPEQKGGRGRETKEKSCSKATRFMAERKAAGAAEKIGSEDRAHAL